MRIQQTEIKGLLVSIPHSGLLCPAEIPLDSLSEHHETLMDETDWHTDRLYDFQDILGNTHVVFPLSQVFVNVNRHPKHVDQAVPVVLNGIPIYRPSMSPPLDMRRQLVRKYHQNYHQYIKNRKKVLILDGHSTVTGNQDAAGNKVAADIIVSDRQATELDLPGGIRTAPDGYLDCYADELERRLGGNVKIEKNTTYQSTYGHIMAIHGWNGETNRGNRAPLILQETNEELYVTNGRPDWFAIENLRRVFAEALAKVVQTFIH